MPPDEPVLLSGVDQVRRRIECFFSGFTFNLRFDVRQTEVVGPVAFERGSYAAFALLKGEEAEPRGGYGEYILLFERQPDSTWRIAAFGTAARKESPPETWQPQPGWRISWVELRIRKPATGPPNGPMRCPSICRH